MNVGNGSEEGRLILMTLKAGDHAHMEEVSAAGNAHAFLPATKKFPEWNTVRNRSH